MIKYNKSQDGGDFVLTMNHMDFNVLEDLIKTAYSNQSVMKELGFKMDSSNSSLESLFWDVVAGKGYAGKGYIKEEKEL